MRAAWIATVANIDWPSTNNLTTEQQKAEFVNIVERAAQLKLNTLIFQVRPACDALYASSIEPWSEYLTGSMGEAPKPYYDPLKFAIEEAHKRGLELHAWFNPYRARHAAAKSPAGATHISRTHPEFVRKYGKALWLDPGERAVQDYSLRVVMDVVRRYDIDGVHFDDYFYPYKEQDAAGKDLDFPDEASWRRYGAGGKLSRDDWRRENVNAFIQRVYQSVKSAKPWVKFGVSPFGIWRPGNPRQIQGYDAYAKLYADSRKWLVNGWVDYFAPQLYWSISAPEQSFPVLLKWWEEQNPKRRHLVPGMDSTRTLRSWPPQEIVNQILLTRKQPGTSGHVLWNMKSVMQNERLSEALAHEVYVQPALIPALPWLQRVPPAKPKLSAAPSGAKAEVTWLPGKPGEAWLWVFQTRRGGKWSTQILPAAEQTQVLTQPLPEIISVSAVDRFGNMSRATALQVVKN
jgi:uncharacterized lipoprotein YddW (UPF0748 family)